MILVMKTLSMKKKKEAAYRFLKNIDNQKIKRKVAQIIHESAR